MAHNFPDVTVDGANYPAPPNAVLLAKFAAYLQMAGMALMFFGPTLLSVVGINMSPATQAFIAENKLMIIGGLFMFNTFAQNGMATGAFEVEFNGKVVFSKLETGRMPTLDDLVRPLKESSFHHTGSEAFGNVAM